MLNQRFEIEKSDGQDNLTFKLILMIFMNAKMTSMSYYILGVKISRYNKDVWVYKQTDGRTELINNFPTPVPIILDIHVYAYTNLY